MFSILYLKKVSHAQPVSRRDIPKYKLHIINQKESIFLFMLSTGSSRMNVKSNKAVKIYLFMFELFRHLPCDPKHQQIYCNAITVLILSNFVWFQSSTMAPLQMARPPTSEAFLGYLSL